MQHLIKISIPLILCFVCVAANSESQELPHGVVEQLPRDFSVMVAKSGDFNNDKLIDYVVVLHKDDEKDIFLRTEKAPPRPLMVFGQKADGRFDLIARNDNVVYAVDEGGQCDPFLDSGEGVVLKGYYFTVENGVACGAHWTDYITFKYSEKLHNWIFHKRIFEHWVMNNNTDSNSDALIFGGRTVKTGKQNSPLLLKDYKRD